MPIEIRVPRLGWSMEEGGFVAWLKNHGDNVRRGEPLFVLEGDKATQEIEATETGILHIPETAPQPGSPVSVGTLLGYLLAPDEARSGIRPAPDLGMSGAPAKTPTPVARAATTPAAQPAAVARPAAATRPAREAAVSSTGRLAISPRALRSAAELGVDWSRLRGTGRSGRIREQDVLRAKAVLADSHRHGQAAGRQERNAQGKTLTAPATVPPGTVVITDWTFSDLAVEEGILKPLGVNLVTRQCRNEEDLTALVQDADVVITQFARLTSSVIACMRRARAIVRYGIGVDNIDLNAAHAQGIPVANVPDYCIDEVADQTLAFILALTRQVVPYHQHVTGGHWGLALPIDSMRALRDLAVGVVGFGRIGRAVVRRLLPFQCEILAFDPIVPADEIQRAGARAMSSLEELLATCDLLTVHCPSTLQTRRMLNAAAFAKMKRGALLVNVARGDIIETNALVEALSSGRLGAAALDVCDPEPIPALHPILKLPNVILAPHVASVSAIAVRTLRETVATQAALALANGLPPNIVNGVTRLRSSSYGGQAR